MLKVALILSLLNSRVPVRPSGLPYPVAFDESIPALEVRLLNELLVAAAEELSLRSLSTLQVAAFRTMQFQLH